MDCIFLRMATRSCRHNQIGEGRKPTWHLTCLTENGTCTFAVGHRSTESSLAVKRELLHEVITPCSAWITMNHKSFLTFLVALGCILHCLTPYSWVKAQKYFGSEQIYLISPKCLTSKQWHNTWLILSAPPNNARKTAYTYFSHSQQNIVSSLAHRLLSI